MLFELKHKIESTYYYFNLLMYVDFYRYKKLMFFFPPFFYVYTVRFLFITLVRNSSEQIKPY